VERMDQLAQNIIERGPLLVRDEDVYVAAVRPSSPENEKRK
jgi:hypothetical protein